MDRELAHRLFRIRPNYSYNTDQTRFHYNIQRLFTPLITTFLLDMRVTGRDNIPQDGGFILAVNHVMFYDVVPVQIALGARPIFYMAKGELFSNPLTALLFRSLLAFPVQRGAGDATALDFARRLLERGQVVGIFPEGTRSHGRGLGRGKSGAARLALLTGAPILPVAIDGTQDLLRAFPRRTQVRISIAAPLFPLPQEKVTALTERAMRCIAEMLPEKYQGQYSAASEDSPSEFIS